MQADYVLDYNVVSVAREQRVFLLARINAGETTALAERRPLNLSVVLDRSGSMAGDKLEYVKKAAQFLVHHLGKSDRFSVVTYDENVKVEHQPAPVIHKDVIRNVIQNIRSGGTTNLSGGWLQGCQLVAEGKADGQVDRVLLLTDGLANVGITDPARLGAMARQKREEGVTTTTMGVGMGFNEDLLVQMAHEGGGAFYFIDNPDQAPAIFSEELQDLLNVVGQNLVITLTLSADVKMIRQLNTYPAEAQDRVITFRLGDLYADEVKTLLLELSIPALETLGEVEVARLRFDYDELLEDQATHHTVEIPIMVNVAAAGELEGREPNREVVRSALLLQAARARDEAIKQADRGEFDAARDTLGGAAEAIKASGFDDADLQAEHDMLREEAMDMELGKERYDSYTRKTQTSKIFTASLDRRASHAQTTAGLHQRMKAAREAIERGGPTPEAVEWRKESLELQGKDLVSIGRADDNDIIVPEIEVSQYHCQLVREGDDLYLEDLNSTNGTFANGGQIKGRFRLSVGDVATVGTRLFMFRARDKK